MLALNEKGAGSLDDFGLLRMNVRALDFFDLSELPIDRSGVQDRKGKRVYDECWAAYC